MKPEEAIETIKIALAEVEWNYPMDYTVAFEEAIMALEKQIPKKPKETDAYPHKLYCPTCYWTFYFNKENADGYRRMHMFTYCPECGQAIDWSDNNG